MKRIAIAVLALGLLVVSPQAAFSEATEEEKKVAEKYYRAGEQAYKAGQYMDAAQAFEEALKLYPVPAIVFATAQAYRLQFFIDKDPGWLKRSLELYRQYVKEVQRAGRRDDAVASLAELEPIMLRIEAEKKGPIRVRQIKASTQLMVNAQVRNARASVDGVEGAIPMTKLVTPGRHTVKVTAEGYYPIEQTANAVEGRLVVVEVKLVAKPAWVKLRTDGGAQVSVDGRPVGTAPFARALELKAGKHFITVTQRGRYAWSREITVKRGEEIELHAPLRSTRQRKLTYYVMGASLFTFGIAAIAGGQALGADSDAADLNTKRQEEGLTVAELDEYNQLRDRRDDKMRDMYIALSIGGAIAVTGTLMWLLDSPRAEMPPAGFGAGGPAESEGGSTFGVAPIIRSDLAGVAVAGRF